MAFGIKTVALAAATVAVNGVAAEVAHGAECTPCAGTYGTCEIKSKVNFFAGETGTRMMLLFQLCAWMSFAVDANTLLIFDYSRLFRVRRVRWSQPNTSAHSRTYVQV